MTFLRGEPLRLNQRSRRAKNTTKTCTFHANFDSDLPLHGFAVFVSRNFEILWRDTCSLETSRSSRINLKFWKVAKQCTPQSTWNNQSYKGLYSNEKFRTLSLGVVLITLTPQFTARAMFHYVTMSIKQSLRRRCWKFGSAIENLSKYGSMALTEGVNNLKYRFRGVLCILGLFCDILQNKVTFDQD